MRNNFDINSTKQDLQDVCWKEFGTTWQNKKKLNCEWGDGGRPHDGQRFGTVNALYLHNSQTQIHQIYRFFCTH